MNKRTIGNRLSFHFTLDYSQRPTAAEEVSEKWNDIRSICSFLSFVETNVLNKEEMGELVDTTITQADLSSHPEEVKEVARFSMEIKASRRQSVDTFIHESIVESPFSLSYEKTQANGSSKGVQWLGEDRQGFFWCSVHPPLLSQVEIACVKVLSTTL